MKYKRENVQIKAMKPKAVSLRLIKLINFQLNLLREDTNSKIGNEKSDIMDSTDI